MLDVLQKELPEGWEQTRIMDEMKTVIPEIIKLLASGVSMDHPDASENSVNPVLRIIGTCRKGNFPGTLRNDPWEFIRRLVVGNCSLDPLAKKDPKAAVRRAYYEAMFWDDADAAKDPTATIRRDYYWHHHMKNFPEAMDDPDANIRFYYHQEVTRFNHPKAKVDKSSIIRRGYYQATEWTDGDWVTDKDEDILFDGLYHYKYLGKVPNITGIFCKIARAKRHTPLYHRSHKAISHVLVRVAPYVDSTKIKSYVLRYSGDTSCLGQRVYSHLRELMILITKIEEGLIRE